MTSLHINSLWIVKALWTLPLSARLPWNSQRTLSEMHGTQNYMFVSNSKWLIMKMWRSAYWLHKENEHATQKFQKRAIWPYDSCLSYQLVHIKSLRLSATKEAAKRPRWLSGIPCILTKLRGTWRYGTERQVWRPVQWKVCTYKQQDNGKNSWTELVWKGQISAESHRNENHQTADFLSKDLIQNARKFFHSAFETPNSRREEDRKRKDSGNLPHAVCVRSRLSACDFCAPFGQPPERQLQINTGFSEISALSLESQAVQ